MKDETAAALSGLCLIHCSALSLGGLGLAGRVFTSAWMHLALFAPIAVLALWSLPRGWRLHRQWAPPLAGLAGVGLLFTAMLAPHHAEAPLSVTGGLLLIGAHLTNRRHCRQSESRCPGRTTKTDRWT